MARKFYAADSKLTTEDRKEMYQSIWRSWAVRPLGGLALAWAGIMTPIWLKRSGRMNPKRQTRGLQVTLGFGGLFFGQGITAAIGYNYYYYKFQKKNSNMAVAWGMLGLVPSRLPARYYELTSKDPRYIMKDPDTIDWRTEVRFPLNLVAHRDNMSNVYVYGDRKAGEFRPASSTYGQLPTEPGAQTTERDSFLSQPPPETSENSENQQPPMQKMRWQPPGMRQPAQPPASSWDQVRQADGGAQNRTQDTTSSNQGWAPPPLPESSQGWTGGAPATPQNEARRELEEEQKKFDALVDQARTGAGVGDDFTESEKKWR